MKVTNKGVVFEGCYTTANPSTGYCSFTDKDGSTLLIEAATIVRMYEIVKFDLERRGGWEHLIGEMS